MANLTELLGSTFTPSSTEDFSLPATLRYVYTSNLPNLCRHILNNRHSIPSIPSWTVETDVDFALCQESLTLIEFCAANYSDYLYFPKITDFDYSKRVPNLFSLEEIILNFQCGNCESLQGALTFSYHKYLSYKKIDNGLTEDDITEYTRLNNIRETRKPRGPRSKIDRSSYELAQAKWRSAIRKRERVIAEVEEEVRAAKSAMLLEKARIGIKR